MIPIILSDLEEFSLKTHLKMKSLNQLYTMMALIEDKVKPYTEKILKQVVYKLIIDEEEEIRDRASKVAELLGLYIPTDYLLPLIISHLTDSESRAVPYFVSSCLTALSCVITNSSVRFASCFEG